MKKATGTIIGLIVAAMLTLCGCASGDGGNSEETSSDAGGMGSVIENLGETRSGCRGGSRSYGAV